MATSDTGPAATKPTGTKSKGGKGAAKASPAPKTEQEQAQEQHLKDGFSDTHIGVTARQQQVTHEGYVGADRQPLDLSGLGESAGETVVTVKQDVYETFKYPGSKRPGRRLVFHKGQRVPRSQFESAQARAEGKGFAQEEQVIPGPVHTS